MTSQNSVSTGHPKLIIVNTTIPSMENVIETPPENIEQNTNNIELPRRNIDTYAIPIEQQVQIINYLQEELRMGQFQPSPPTKHLLELNLRDYIDPCGAICAQLTIFITRFEDYLTHLDPEQDNYDSLLINGTRVMQLLHITYRLFYSEYHYLSNRLT